MPNVTATQEDPNNAGPENWSPDASLHEREREKEKAALLAEDWGKPGKPANDQRKPEKTAKGKPAPVVDDDDLDEDDDDEEDDDEFDAIESGGETTKKRASVDDDDEDEEDDEEDEDDDEDDDDEDERASDDPDADLEDEDEDKPDKDPKVAAGMAKLQRQEKRLREQIDRERESVRAELTQGRKQLEDLQAEIAKSKAKYDGLAERAKLDPLGVLEELGVDDDEFVGKQAHARLKAKTDPAYREAAARMKSERQVRAELDALKAKDAAREKDAEESKKTATQKAELEKLIGGISKEAKSVEKATLTNRLLKSDPDRARSLFAHAHLELWKRDGVEPSAKKVVLAAEKLQRAQLRLYGIDPKTLTAAVIESDDDEKTSPSGSAPKAKAKAAKGKGKPSLDDELRRPTKAELLEEDWTSGKRTR